MIEQGPPQNDFEDVRVKATKIIWALSVAMLGICCGLSPATGTGFIIPVMVIIAAAVSTMSVWGKSIAGAPRVSSGNSASEIETQKRVLELEERLAALESITNFEHRLLEAKYPNATPINRAPLPSEAVAPPQNAA